jgi:hypothetical protein
MNDQPAENPVEPTSADVNQPLHSDGAVQRTRVSKRWMRKMVIFFIVCFGLGSWGLLDAVKVYPDRGRMYAKFMLSDYLKAADETGLIGIPRRVNVPDPASEYASLQGRSEQLNPLEVLRLRWLDSLRPIYGTTLDRLTEQNQRMAERPEDEREDTVTVFRDPAATYAEISSEISGRSVPKPLTQTDIAVQWLICAAGYIGAGLILMRITQTKATVYRYEPADHKLILPKGKSITPDEIETVDKSKWHKFFVALDLKDGGSHKFDLLRFEPLEDWILEMEEADPRLRAARDEAAAEEEAAAAEQEHGESAGEDDQQP